MANDSTSKKLIQKRKNIIRRLVNKVLYKKANSSSKGAVVFKTAYVINNLKKARNTDK